MNARGIPLWARTFLVTIILALAPSRANAVDVCHYIWDWILTPNHARHSQLQRSQALVLSCQSLLLHSGGLLVLSGLHDCTDSDHGGGTMERGLGLEVRSR